jgi:putative flippase GtrA
VGVSTFLLDLGLLWCMTELLHIPYYLSTGIGFLLAVSVNYFISRHFVFSGTTRPLSHGYAFFIIMAVTSAFLISGAVFVLVQYAGLQYLLARTAVAGIVGVVGYLINLQFNFKVVGLH